MVQLLLLLNFVVFVLWMIPLTVSLRFMAANFLVSWEALSEGRFWVLITSAFSHNIFIHIFFNILVLWSFGTTLERTLGPGRFLRFYLLAGAIASFSHAVVSKFILHAPELPALGASGAIAGVVMVFALLFPRERILLFGLVPLPALWGAFAFAGLDIWGLMAQADGGGLPIGHGAHLGGALTGLVYYFFRLRGARTHRPGWQTTY